MSNMTPDEKDKLICSVERIERGLYGDPENGVRGVIDRVAHIERWITKQSLRIAFLTGIFITIGFLIKTAWEWVTRK